jgi:hypothetical protein
MLRHWCDIPLPFHKAVVSCQWSVNARFIPIAPTPPPISANKFLVFSGMERVVRCKLFILNELFADF